MPISDAAVACAGNDAALARALSERTTLLWRTGKIAESIDEGERAVAAARRSGDRDVLALACSRHGDALVEATASNTGFGLGMVAALRGYKLITVLTTKASAEKVALMRAIGAEVVIVPKEAGPDDPDNFFRINANIPPAAAAPV